MRFAPAEEHRALTEAVRAFVDGECTPQVVRTAWEGDAAVAPHLLQQLGDLGLLAALVPEERGGLGLDPGYLPGAMEAIGHAAVPAPIADHVTIVAPSLAAAEHPATDGVLTGHVAVACGIGRSGPVPGAQAADLFLLEVDGMPRAYGRNEVEVEPVDSLDATRRLGHVRPTAGGWPVPEATASAGVTASRLATAAELIGLSQRLLELTVDYVQQREQFGRPIGSFQAIKHHLADAYLKVSFARPAVLRAGATLATKEPGAGRDVDGSLAVAAQTATFVAERAIQCHGAIAYTTEYDLHLYAKRIWSLRAERGDPGDLLLNVADHLRIPEAVR